MRKVFARDYWLLEDNGHSCDSLINITCVVILSDINKNRATSASTDAGDLIFPYISEVQHLVDTIDYSICSPSIVTILIIIDNYKNQVVGICCD